MSVHGGFESLFLKAGKISPACADEDRDSFCPGALYCDRTGQARRNEPFRSR